LHHFPAGPDPADRIIAEPWAYDVRPCAFVNRRLATGPSSAREDTPSAGMASNRLIR